MKIKNKQDNNAWLDEKHLKRNALLLYENYDVTEKELEQCKRIVEEFRDPTQFSSAQ